MTNERDDDVSLERLLERHRDGLQEELHTAIPGRVESFDAASQTASVTPLISRALPKPDGTMRYEQMPTIHAVPVVFPGAGGWFVRFPITAGDTVLLIVCERDLAGWRRSGGQSDPIDVRAHHLSHATAIPGLRSRPGQLPAPAGNTPSLELGHVGGSTILIGSDGTIQLGGPSASEQVALATKVDLVFAAIRNAFNGDAIPAAVNAVFPALSSVASTKVSAL